MVYGATNEGARFNPRIKAIVTHPINKEKHIMCIYPCKDKYQESWNIGNESREVDTTMCLEIPTASWVLNMEGNIVFNKTKNGYSNLAIYCHDVKTRSRFWANQQKHRHGWKACV